ncbi:MAG: hypothetical protein WA484_06195 [Solirubrobacteraceae bacterium]
MLRRNSEQRQCQRLGHALSQRGGDVGPGTVEFRGEELEALLGEIRVLQRPRAALPLVVQLAIRDCLGSRGRRPLLSAPDRVRSLRANPV